MGLLGFLHALSASGCFNHNCGSFKGCLVWPAVQMLSITLARVTEAIDRHATCNYSWLSRTVHTEMPACGSFKTIQVMIKGMITDMFS